MPIPRVFAANVTSEISGPRLLGENSSTYLFHYYPLNITEIRAQFIVQSVQAVCINSIQILNVKNHQLISIQFYILFTAPPGMIKTQAAPTGDFF